MKKIKKLLVLFMAIISFTYAEELSANKKMNILGNIGQISPLTSADRSLYNAGYSMGINLSFPDKEISIFKHPFTMGMELNLSNLDGNQSDDLKINTLAFQLLTAFDKLPVDFSFGFGITDVSVKGLSGSGTLDIMHKLPNEKLDISIGIRFQQIFDLKKNHKIKHLHGLYGLNVKFGKTINF